MQGLGVVCCQQNLCSVLWGPGQYVLTSSILLILCGYCAVYYSQIKKIESYVFEGHEDYSMVAFHLIAEGMLLACCWHAGSAGACRCHGSCATFSQPLFVSGKGKYWLYWFSSQYTAALKVRIIGVSALI